MLPREEDPQIKVPMIDVMVAMPGASPKEVEQRVTMPMEKLLWEVPGVEYIYSTSEPGESLVTVRFKVGEDVERALVRLTQKLRSNYDRIPHGVSEPLIKPWSIDDVPILTLTFHSQHYDHFMLRRLVAQVNNAVKQVPEVAQTMIIGGDRREMRVLLDPARLAAYNLSAADIVPMLMQDNRQVIAGGLTSQNQDIMIETGGFLANAREVGDVVVGVIGDTPVYLGDVAQIRDGPGEPSQYVFFGDGAATSAKPDEQPAVTLTVAKRPGANAISVVNEVLQKVDTLKGRIIPGDVQVTVTRNYGATAEEKSNELLFHMLLAVIGVSVLILLALGWREAGIVAIAIPCTLALTLLIFYLYGFTLNRITLFALIFSIGILVDDAIVVVENIVRHFHLPQNKGRNWSTIAVEAVNEVGNPTILATFAVIAAVLPMAFVGGLMGPYMRPIPIGSSAAMAFSLAIAFIVTPWASIRILRWGRKYSCLTAGAACVTEAALDESAKTADSTVRSPTAPPIGSEISVSPEQTFFTRTYLRLMRPLVARRRARALFLGGLVVLLLVSMALVGVGFVKVKMLPFDNKSEFQIILNMPQGSSLERTAECAQEIANAVRSEREVANYQIYVGTAAPFNFNGLVRHYFLRSGANVADVQINLVPKHQRWAQSHEIAERVRPRVAAIAAKFNARVTVAEVPPGPPVLQTLVAEIYGPTEKDRLMLAQKVIDIFHNTPGVVDTDWYFETNPPAARFVVDKEKAALDGVSAATVDQTIQIAVGGEQVGLLHAPHDVEDVPIVLQLSRRDRTSPDQLLALRLRSASKPGAPLVPLSELARIEPTSIDQSLCRKNLMPVVYVVGDVAGQFESPVYAILEMDKSLRKLYSRQFGGDGSPLKILNYDMPYTENQPVVKWDGEWHITIEVFRDLGIAFGAVLVLIYILMVGWFRSYLTPLIVMMVIPFSLIGILPAHAALHAFFTDTSMIGFMAGAGIVVRNSIILVDFIELRVAQGRPLAEAVVEAGMIRFRPIMLTALAVVAGATVILFDPIFQGLAISLMAGSLTSMFTAPVLVPLLYFMAKGKSVSSSVQIQNC